MEGENYCCFATDLFEIFSGEDGVCDGYVWYLAVLSHCALC